MSILTLPGTIPNLLRRGSPVTLRPRVYGEVTLMHGGQGVVHDAARGVAVVDTFGGSPRVVRYGREDVALDLTDATGRAHAAWWLAGAIGKPVKNGALWLAYGGDARPAFFRPPVGWALQHDAGQEWFSRGTGWAQQVGAVACLDACDDTRLPDGSRWVDAEALRLVCLHVAGLPS